MLSCDEQGEMLDFDVPSGSRIASPNSKFRDPRSAYTQSQMSALVEIFMVDELEEFVSYVFNVTVETSEGVSPSVSSCFKTGSMGKGDISLSLSLSHSSCSTFISMEDSHHIKHIHTIFSSWNSHSSVLHNSLQHLCMGILDDAARSGTQWHPGCVHCTTHQHEYIPV